MLLRDAGIRIAAKLDPSTHKFFAPDVPARDPVSSVAASLLAGECSGAYIDNDVLLEEVVSLVRRKRPDGIIWHILKGQVEYDFELLRAERTLEEMGVCVFRLETDYQYQDIEQLRVRIEAFSELLGARKVRPGIGEGRS